jgi:hypothetical protein
MRDHLGERVAALVDGELGHDARERALAHLAGCQACRHEVETQRLLKNALRGAVAVPALERVSELMRGVPVPRRGAQLLSPTGYAAEPAAYSLSGGPAPSATLDHLPPRPPRPVPHGWRRRRILVAASLTAGLGIAALAGLGGGERPTVPRGPSVDPASTAYLQLSSSSGLVAGGLPGASAAAPRR